MRQKWKLSLLYRGSNAAGNVAKVRPLARDFEKVEEQGVPAPMIDGSYTNSIDYESDHRFADYMSQNLQLFSVFPVKGDKMKQAHVLKCLSRAAR